MQCGNCGDCDLGRKRMTRITRQCGFGRKRSRESHGDLARAAISYPGQTRATYVSRGPDRIETRNNHERSLRRSVWPRVISQPWLLDTCADFSWPLGTCSLSLVSIWRAGGIIDERAFVTFRDQLTTAITIESRLCRSLLDRGSSGSMWIRLFWLTISTKNVTPDFLYEETLISHARN